MKSFGLTDRGIKRENNEDSILVNNELGLFAVADGMGGHLHGEVASSTATKVIGEVILHGMLNADRDFLADEARISALIREAVSRANAEVFDLSRQLTGHGVIGTTLTLTLFISDRLHVGHVGDSRFCRIRNGTFEQLTLDHTRAQELVDDGLLSPEDAENHRTSHLLTRAVGVAAQVTPDLFSEEVLPGDRFLLSSDGLFRVVDAPTVLSVIVSNKRVAEQGAALLNLALERGAPDNISLILVEPEKKGLFQRIFSRR